MSGSAALKFDAPHAATAPALQEAAGKAAELSAVFEPLSAEERLSRALGGALPGPIALVSSFGADSAVLLHMAAQIDRAVPVLFLQTEMLFEETLEHQRRIAARLGLSDVRLLRPDAAEAALEDPDRLLHRSDQNACCDLRKTRPLERALSGFASSISGRKRHQAATRAQMTIVEAEAEGRLKLNPLADWSSADLRAYRERADLPPHPLVSKGYPSIGCAPCTTKVASGEDERAGRWRGSDKTECGIHVVDGRIVRLAGG